MDIESRLRIKPGGTTGDFSSHHGDLSGKQSMISPRNHWSDQIECMKIVIPDRSAGKVASNEGPLNKQSVLILGGL